jgi:hypothetical protein
MMKNSINQILLYVCTPLLGFIGGFFGAYTKKRGENLATKADFDELLKQHKITQGVKLELGHSDWVLKEQKTIKRQKLEEFILALYETEEWLDDYRSEHVFFIKTIQTKISPIFKLEMITLLYFQEFDDEIHLYARNCLQERKNIIDTCKRILGSRNNIDLQKNEWESFKKVSIINYENRLEVIYAIKEKARKIMNELIIP